MSKAKRVFLILLALAFATLGISCEKKQAITGEQMIFAQIEFSEGFLSIMDEMAESYSEYISFNISEQRFKEDIEGYLKRINYEEERYKQFNKKYYLDSQNTETNVMKAVTCIEEARHIVKDILENSVDKGRALSREELLELYIEGSNSIQEKLNKFAGFVENV